MTLMQMSMTGGLMILMVVALRALLLNRLPKRTFVTLWMLALIRLLIPFSIPSKLSVYSAASRIPEAALADGIAPEPVRAFVRFALPIAQRSMPVSTSLPPAAIAPQTAPLNWLLIIYIAGAVLLAAYLLSAYAYLRREFRQAREIVDGPAEWIAAQGLKRHVRVLSSAKIKSPITYGLLRPCILLPEALLLDRAQLEYVLAHEITHIRRFDAPMKLLFALCLCAHWFNPLVWAMYILYNRDVELSCDERVMRLMGAAQRADYATLLLDLQSEPSRLTPLSSSFSRHCIKERIVAIMKYKKASALAICLALILVISITTAFVTSAEPVIPSVNPAWIDTFAEYESQTQSENFEPNSVLLQLIEQDYENMSVRQFSEILQNAYEKNTLSPGELRDNYEGDDVRDDIRKLVNGAAWRASMEMGYLEMSYPRYFFNPPGTELLLTNPKSSWEEEATTHTATAQGLLTFETLDPDAITVGERERLLLEYQQRMEVFFQGLSLDELLESDPVALLNAERDRVTAELNTPALRMRAINFTCMLTADGHQYSTPSSFIDNVEVPPAQIPLTAPGIALLHTDAMLGISYGELDEQGVISSDGGQTWYENGFRDPKTGVSHRYNPKTDKREVSPDNGENWFVEVGWHSFEQKNTGYSMGYLHNSGWFVDSPIGFSDWKSITLAESFGQADEFGLN